MYETRENDNPNYKEIEKYIRMKPEEREKLMIELEQTALKEMNKV